MGSLVSKTSSRRKLRLAGSTPAPSAIDPLEFDVGNVQSFLILLGNSPLEISDYISFQKVVRETKLDEATLVFVPTIHRTKVQGSYGRLMTVREILSSSGNILHEPTIRGSIARLKRTMVTPKGDTCDICGRKVVARPRDFEEEQAVLLLWMKHFIEDNHPEDGLVCVVKEIEKYPLLRKIAGKSHYSQWFGKVQYWEMATSSSRSKGEWKLTEKAHSFMSDVLPHVVIPKTVWVFHEKVYDPPKNVQMISFQEALGRFSGVSRNDLMRKDKL